MFARVVEVDIEHLAVAAPVAAEVEDDALVLRLCALQGFLDLRLRQGWIGIEHPALRERGLNDERHGHTQQSRSLECLSEFKS